MSNDDGNIKCPMHPAAGCIGFGERIYCHWCDNYGVVNDESKAVILTNVGLFTKAVARLTHNHNPYIYIDDLRLFYNSQRAARGETPWIVYCRSSEIGWYRSIDEIKRKLLV